MVAPTYAVEVVVPTTLTYVKAFERPTGYSKVTENAVRDMRYTLEIDELEKICHDCAALLEKTTDTATTVWLVTIPDGAASLFRVKNCEILQLGALVEVVLKEKKKEPLPVERSTPLGVR